jgi:hypothetical protein
LEYANSDLDQDPISNAVAAARSEGVRKIQRIGLYSPTGGPLPMIPSLTLARLQELGTEDLVIIFSPGTGDRVEKSLAKLLQEEASN